MAYKEGDRVIGLFDEGVVEYMPSEYDYRINLSGHYYALDDTWYVLKEED